MISVWYGFILVGIMFLVRDMEANRPGLYYAADVFLIGMSIAELLLEWREAHTD